MSKNTSTSTQAHLPIAGIQDGVIIMNDASVRAILRIDPINFELKSEQEQNGIIYGYQGFLNSLEFPIQIVIQSKKLDLERYLLRLEEAKKTMTSELLQIQTEDYVDFIRRLISVANIMSKRFYVVVSYALASKNAGFGLASLGNIFRHTATGPLLDQDQFSRYRSEVINRANLVGGGLSRLGVKATVLDTQQLIELFYSIYNPDIAAEERLTNIGDLATGVVSSPDAPTAADATIPDAPPIPTAPVLVELLPLETAIQDPAQLAVQPPVPKPIEEPLSSNIMDDEPPVDEPKITQ